jgi:hypothetical protein
METTGHAVELLRQTEEKLRGLVSQAAQAGDYPSVVRIAAWAQAVAGLTKSSVTELVHHPTGPANKTKRIPGTTSAVSSRHSRANQNGYPKFLRQGDELIRIAWSKKEKREYRHKTPHAALKALANAIAAKGADGRVFSTDEFLPIQDPSQGVEIPNYQAYVGISFLKQTGLIDQHGRQGYSIPRAAELKDAVEVFWKKLPDR